MQLCPTSILGFVIIFPHLCWSQYEALSGDQIWEIQGEVGLVSTMLYGKGFVDILDESGPRRVIRVRDRHSTEVLLTLLQNKLPYKVLVEDLASYLKEKEGQRKRKTKSSSTCSNVSCPQPLSDAYMTLDQIEWYLKEINITYSSRLSVTSIGKSIEGRDIWQVHIRPQSCSVGSSVWIEAGIHAREWIAPAVALQMIPLLLEDCSRIGTLDIYIVPMANPDGYLYTWTNDRYWRKNRRKNNGTCDGVDLNRNWDYKFGLFASDDPCADDYKGSAGFSEPETQALSDAMLAVAKTSNLLMVMTFHSFGQYFLYPWGWTAEPAPDTPKMINRGELWAAAAKKRYGTVYKVTNSGSGLYLASGATDDWAKAVLKVNYSYTVELRDEVTRGFVLPPDQIKPCSEEVWDGMEILLKAVGPGEHIFL
ncbi:carboxypeptidase B-like isoform X2 [Macrobrachium rosenbergii]|uniref:carboxypeptidase B-like isoform X2 n=1 Tax=Macrobrachium rosenbergii TaxID=79674 RepID=UPI0034D66A56